jgi:uncharacterized membrane protein
VDHGYLIATDATFTTIDFLGTFETQLSGINPAGEIVGSYSEQGGATLGFVRDRHGNFMTIDVSGAEAETNANDISAGGEIVGQYQDANGVDHGFLMTRSGAFFTIDYPGAVTTSLHGINAVGEMVGEYRDQTGLHGFVLKH